MSCIHREITVLTQSSVHVISGRTYYTSLPDPRIICENISVLTEILSLYYMALCIATLAMVVFLWSQLNTTNKTYHVKPTSNYNGVSLFRVANNISPRSYVGSRS